MKIEDITLRDVVAGKNWKVLDGSRAFDMSLDGQAQVELQELSIDESEDFSDEDYIVYSGVSVTLSGKVAPLLLIKRVGNLDYGGDYCEFHEGRWRRVGIEPNPNAEFSFEYFAAPLRADRSFDSDQDELRNDNREQFRKYHSKLLQEA